MKKSVHGDLIALIPKGADRVSVKTQKGEQKYRLISEIVDTDEIQLNRDGIPIVMKGSPGRRKIPVIEPVNDLVKELLRRKRETLDDDPVLKSAKLDSASPDMLHHVLLALGEEAACIRFERLEAERNGGETSSYSLRRIAALKALVDTWMKRKEQLGSRDVDLKAPAVRMLIKYVLDTMREAMSTCGEREEMIKTVYAKTAQMMGDESWESDLRNRMKNAT